MAARAAILGDTGANHPDHWVGSLAGEDLHAISMFPRGFGPDVSQSYHNRFFHLLVFFHAAMFAPINRECRSQTFETQIIEQQP
jgi:hypothetical protein